MLTESQIVDNSNNSKLRVPVSFLFLGWGLAAVAWGTYFFVQNSAHSRQNPIFLRYLVAGAVVFSFWLVAIPVVGKWAMLWPLVGESRKAHVWRHLVLAPVVFVVHMVWLAIVAPTVFSIFGWDSWSHYWSNLTAADFFFNVRGPVDIAIYWATIFGFGTVSYYRRFNERDLQARQLETELERVRLDLSDSERTKKGLVSRIPIKSADGSYLIDAANIDWIEAADSYVVIHAEGKKHLLRESMRWFEQHLDSRQYFRSHRRGIVNTAKVKEVHTGTGSDFVICLHSGAQVPLSRRRRRSFEQLLGRPI